MIAKLKDGFEIQIDDNSLNSWDLLEVLSDIDEGETGLIVKAARLLLGKNGVNELKEHLRNDKGKVPANVMVQAIAELMESANELKNS